MLMLLCSCGQPEEVRRAPDFRATYQGSLDATLPFGNELTITAGTDITEPLQRAVERELERVLPDALACMEGIYGTAWTETTFDASGAVTTTNTALLGDCIDPVLRTMSLGPVEGAPVVVRYPVRNMPSAQQLEEAARLLGGGS